MPVRTSSLSIKAFPLEMINKEQSEKVSQILSPSSILPTTALFTLQITTEAAAKLTYKITVKQSNNLMQKSALFYDLSTQYTDYASQSSLNSSEDNNNNNNSSNDFTINNDSSLEELMKEADGLPMICIELPNISIEIIDNLLQWLFNNNNNNEIKFDDILTSNLASSIKSTFDFFGLLNFVTMLNLYEPYCSIIDEILVWYYFGLNERERNLKILKNESFINGTIPVRFVKRLAESVGELEGKQILSSFFRYEEISSKENEWEILSLTEDNNNNNNNNNGFNNVEKIEKSRSNILEWLNSSVLSPTPHRVNFLLQNSLSPLDIAEPPTPLGSAYFCIPPPPNTPSTSTFQRILPRSLPRTPKTTTFTKSIISFSPSSSINEKIILDNDDMLEDIPLTAGLSVPPNTPNLPFIPSNIPNLLIDNDIVLSKSLTNNLMPPSTPISPANLIVPPNTPNTLSMNVVSPNTPSTPSFYSPLVPPNTPNTPFSPISSNFYNSAITINSLLFPTSIIPTTPTLVPPNSPTFPFIFQSINNNNNDNNDNISSLFNHSKNKFPRKNSREKNVTIDSVLANSLNNLY
ncbi:hypothetical protein C1645_842317 [Glomus cerebriforme]|uniref:Uncharacterized protein n=1 Tax=Glomus cerebriforme TaxID=658196 RepID=A0A397S244_9GLOM|nr:hypothetical protein C1645_842317 [Glomus cerebriforme]